SYALSWKPCQGDSLNLPDHRAQVDQGSQIKMNQVKEMMQDNDLKNSKSKDKGSKSRSQSMNEQSRYKQDKTKTRQSINVKSHVFNVKGDNDKSKQTPTRMSSVPEFESYGPKSVNEDISNKVRETLDAPLVEKLVLDDKLEKKTVFPTVTKIEFVRPKQ
ncbi:hypothetical protein Tco_1432422, partial [Tanacetum coccineum]